MMVRFHRLKGPKNGAHLNHLRTRVKRRWKRGYKRRYRIWYKRSNQRRNPKRKQYPLNPNLSKSNPNSHPYK